MEDPPDDLTRKVEKIVLCVWMVVVGLTGGLILGAIYGINVGTREEQQHAVECDCGKGTPGTASFEWIYPDRTPQPLLPPENDRGQEGQEE